MKKMLQNKLMWLFLCVGIFATHIGWTQDRQITGKVTGTLDNAPLPGVSIILKGTTRGTTTGTDGSFKINVNDGSTLIFSSLGFEKKEIKTGTQTILNVSLSSSTSSLDEVIVTALGITQEKKSLGYAVQEVKSEAIRNSGQTNIVSALQGQIAGAIITGSGGDPGGGTNIILRGVTSLSSGSNNQPLFVIDGIIISNSTDAGNPLPSSGSNAANSAEQFSNTNRAADINPNDVESISVLKGPAATALYGLRASNGAIIIKTKSATSGKMTVDVSIMGGISNIGKSPRIQTRFMQGRLGEFIPEDDPNGRSIFRSFGPLVGPNDQVYDNFRNFYQTGVTSRNNIVIGKGSPKGNIRLSLGYNYDKGTVPFSDFKRTTIKVNGLRNITDKLTVTGSFNFINSGGNRPPSGDKSVFSSLSYWPNSYDVNDFQKADGSQKNITFGVVDNPKFLMFKSPRIDNNDRIIADASIQYKLAPWLIAKYQLTYDTYSEKRTRLVDSTFDVGSQVNGFYSVESTNFREINSNFYLTAQKTFTDKLSGSLMIGNAILDSKRPDGILELGENWKPPYNVDVVNGFKNYTKLALSPQQLRIVSYFADAKLNFSDFLYLNITGRNDIVSTLPTQNNSFFYPSANLGYIFSENLPKNNILSYGKLRLSWAQVGKGTDPYVSGVYYNITGNFPFGGTIPGYRRISTTAEPDLKPERTTSIEIGTELRFFKNRFAVDATYYTMDSKDQIVNAPVANSSGFSRYYTNIGLIRNQGVEVMLTAKLIQQKNFTWDMSLNASTQKGTVIEMPDYLKEITYYDGSATLKVRQGSRLGDLWVNDYLRSPDGKTIIGANGFPSVDFSQQVVMGNAFPDFIAGMNNTFRYKGLSMSFLLELRQGGSVNDIGEVNSMRNGITQLTERRYERVVFNGVVKNADGTFAPNTNAVVLDDNFYRSSGQFYSSGAFVLQDASWFRVRNVNIGFALPDAITRKTIFKRGVRATLTGTNLFLSTPFRGYDPDALAFGSGTNLVGFVGRVNPSVRSFQLTLNFGL